MNENFMISLEIMGKGMLGIFVTITVVMLLVWILGAAPFFKDKPEDDD